MKWLFFLIFIIISIFQAIPVFAQESLAVKVELSSAPHRTVAPKSLLTSVFTVINSGTKKDTYILEAKVPDGWQIISSLAPISLLPKQTKIVPLTVFIPSKALATVTYQISLSVTSQIDPQVTDEALVTVQVLPHARVKVIGPSREVEGNPGQSISYSFIIINLGNGRDKFKITASSAHGEKVDLSKEIVELGVGEQEEIVATIHIPLDVSPGTKHCLTLRATSILLEKRVFDEVVVYTSIRERKPKKEVLYKTLPSQIIFHLSGLGTGRTLSPQVEFYTGGYLNDKYWTNFAFQGPYFKDRENYRGLSKEMISLDFGSDFWDIGLGDTTVNLSELSVSSLSERGVRFRIQKSPISAMFFDLERKQTGFKEDLLGANITSRIGERTELGVNFFQADEDKTDLSVLREPEEKKILSISTLHKLKDFLIQAEYAGSRFDDGSGEKEDKAWWINSKLKKEWLYIDTEYIHAGSNFPGRRRDNEGYSTYLSYRLFKPLWLWTYKHKSHNNINKDPQESTDHTDRVEIGASLTTKRLPYLSLSYQIDKTKSEQQTLLSDCEEKALTFRSHKSFGLFSVSFNSKWGEKQDEIKSIDSKTSEYTTRLYGHWKRLSGWVGYSYNVEKDIIEDEKTIFRRKETGLQYQPSSKISSSVSFSQEGNVGEKENEILSLDINYNPWEDTSFSLEGEMKSARRQFGDEWRFWLTFRKRFDLLIPWMKIKGGVEGIVFLDENDNGLFDKAEKGISEITLVLNGDQAITNKKGRFEFPPLVPGEYELSIDISSLPVGLASRLPLPYKISLPKGRVVEVNIPLVKVCKVKGTIFEDKNKNGKRDEEEDGISLVRILLSSDSLISKEAFSNVDGKYSFTGVLPGKYKVSIDEAWLPERYILTTPSSYSIDLAPGQEISNLDFGSIEKERPIIKTFSAPTVESIYPEEKEEPPKFKYLTLVLLIFVLLASLLIFFLRHILKKIKK